MPCKEDFPDTPIIWLINENSGFTAPVGEIINYDIERKEY
jgi:hypothetical protein